VDEEAVELDKQIALITSVLERSAVRLDANFVSNLPGNWRVIPRDAAIKALIARASRTFKPGDLDNLSDSLAQREIKKSVLRSLRRLVGATPFAEIVNDKGDKVRVYAKARSSKSTSPAPIGDNRDIKIATEGIAKVRETINKSKPILVSIVGPSTRTPDGSAASDSKVWGFAYRGGGAHIIPDRIKKFSPTKAESDPYDPSKSWHSVPSNNDYTARSSHTVYHEIGHVTAYDSWGSDAALKDAYQAFNLKGQVVSQYGKKSTHEHFAEAFARYIQTGDATPEFLDLLRSKGLLKSQQGGSSSSSAESASISDLDMPTVNFSKGPPKPYSPKAGVTSSKDAKEKVLSALLDKVKSGEAPWRKPFKDGFSFAGAFVPRNPASKRVYSGLNSLVLKLHQQLEGYEDPRWMTYNQAQALGGQVRKGEKGTPILVPFKRVKKEKDAGTGEEKITGGYVTFSAKTVFNVSQIDGLNLPDLKTEAGEPKTPLEAQDFIIERYKKSMEAKKLKTPEINYTYVGEYGSHSSSPNWRPSSDEITLPTKEQFNSPEDMFDTITHELAHSTGHPSRLDRSELTKNYSTDNAARGKEELIAEIAAAILASMFGVNSDFDNTAAYVKSWLKALQDNPEMIVGASSDAQKVVDYLLGMDLGDWSPIEGYSTAAKSDKEDE
jgi:antirestriction protein ArdC